MATSVMRMAESDEQQALFDLVREIVTKELAPRASEAEAAKEFPADAYKTLGQAGLMSLPFAEEHGGGAQPYLSYLQVIEEIAAGWASVAVGTSVHAMTCLVVDQNATDEQRSTWLPRMLSGDWLGAYCLSEPQAGSDVASMRAKARRDGDDYVLDGVKQWISNGSHADYYIVFARTDADRTRGISCFIVPADTEGLSFGAPEQKMGLHSDVTTQVILEGARVPATNRLGEEGQGMRIALGALDSGRLGIAAVATGIAQASLAAAVDWANERRQFGRAIGEFQGLQFLLADMAVAVEQARASYLYAARLKDAGLPFSRQASIAKLAATDAAMKVSTDAIQVLGGYGYTAEYPVERYFRDAKVTQIFEGTNQIQRMVIGRDLLA